MAPSLGQSLGKAGQEWGELQGWDRVGILLLRPTPMAHLHLAKCPRAWGPQTLPSDPLPLCFTGVRGEVPLGLGASRS